ncbi:MAG: hypothetical protein KDA92_15120, partial [Planctomycetales bacterium]|nr:hypothetical protein [Planctomycetales bacterium]
AAGSIALADEWAAVQVEQQRLQRWVSEQIAAEQRDAARRKLIRNSVAATLVIVALATVGLLIWLNRRRVPARKQALQAFADREKSVRAEMDQVLVLFDRSREILGTKESMQRRGYTGDTKSLSDEAFQYIDDLLIMSNEVDRVMDEAEELVRPKQVTAKLQNTFSSERYERGINRISGEPLQFHEDQGIPKILQPNQGENGETPESISLTFEQVFSAFRDRGKAAGATLDQLEHALANVNDELNQLQTQIDEATGIEKELTQLAEQDGFFEVPHFFDALLPSAQADQDAAEDIATADPVQAIRQRLPAGARKIAEGLRLAKMIQHARQTVFPTFDEHAPRLRELGYPTEWIAQAAHELGAQADTLFKQAAAESVSANIGSLEHEIAQLGERVAHCAQIAHELQSRDEPAVEQLAAAITDARRQIGQVLKRPEHETLREADAQPDDQVQAARDQLAAARAALQYGGEEAAATAAAALQAAVQQGHEIVDRSLTVLREFSTWQRDAQQRWQQVQHRLHEISTRADETMGQFEPSAWRLRASDPAYPDEAATIDSRRQETRETLERVQRQLQQVPELYAAAQLLKVDTELQDATQGLEQSDGRLHDIQQHIDRLAARIRENESQLQAAAERARQFQSQVAEPRTQRATIEMHAQLERDIRARQQELRQAARQQDPFETAENLTLLDKQVAQLEAQLAADRNAHAEATRAVRGAETQLATALRYVDQASRDGIPDSSLTQRCIREIRQLEPSVDSVSRRLQVAHDDWQDVDASAARLNAELGKQAAQLRGELELAQESVAALERASRDVFSATRWTGGFGTMILGSPGSDELERARRALNSGDYRMMMQLAQAAAMAAQFAIERAQREAERKRREQERAVEAARRAEMQRRNEELQRRSRSSGSSFPSISIGGGGSSFGGSRGSSSRSSGSSGNSGFSRSGW